MAFLKRLISFLFGLTVLAALALAGGWLWFNGQVTAPGPTISEQVFIVQEGETLSSVAKRLETDGFIPDARLLRVRAKLDGTETGIKKGEFVIPAEASVADILDKLVDGKAIVHKLTIPEGFTVAQAMKRIAANKKLTGDLPDVLPAEGEILADTYFFNRGLTRAELVDRMVFAQDRLLEELWETRQADLPIKTPQEAVILASIVEKETGRADERGLVAGLFINRMKKGIRLQSDPTIIYGISKGEPLYNKRGQRRTLYRSEIDRKTDWNTYQIDGLPKTPISNPGRDAIAAVLNPEKTDYIFFVADGKGGHLFAKTNAQHNRNVAAFRRYERGEIERERSGN